VRRSSRGSWRVDQSQIAAVSSLVVHKS